MIQPSSIAVAPATVELSDYEHTASAVEMKAPHQSGIMLVDHQPAFRRALRQALEMYDHLHVVGEVEYGHAALALAPQLQPEIVVIDLGLPDVGGMTLVHQFLSRLPHTRVVLVSVNPNEQITIEAIQAGAFGLLSKNIAPHVLARAIAGVADGEMAVSRRVASYILAHWSRQGSGANQEDVKLTKREIEVLHLMAVGATDRQIAQDLTIEESTAKKHVQHILRKLRARNRADAVAKFHLARSR